MNITLEYYILENNIKYLYVSKKININNIEQKMQKKYNLVKYDSNSNNYVKTLFFGLYDINDYNIICLNKNPNKYLLWSNNYEIIKNENNHDFIFTKIIKYINLTHLIIYPKIQKNFNKLNIPYIKINLEHINNNLSMIDNKIISKFKIETKIIIIILYSEIFSSYILKCLNSIHKQNYTNFEVIIINNMCTDCNNINEYIKNKKKFSLININKNDNIISYQFYYIKYIQHNINKYAMNDIICVIDGNYSLIGNNSFEKINNIFNKEKCWFIFSNNNIDFFEINEKKKINYTILFKLFLINYLNDNNMNDNNMNDNYILLNLTKLVGKNRIKFMENSTQNFYKILSKEHNISKKKIIEDIHIILCYWKRLENLEYQIKNLNEQTVVNRIILHILNNNNDNINIMEEKIKKLSKIYKIRICLSHYDNKYFCFQRFFYIKDIILKNYICDYIIIIDDDQIFNIDWVEKMYNLKKPQTYFSWYVKKWNKTNINYWNGSIYKFKRNQDDYIYIDKEFDYGGPGGSIIDSNIFNNNSKLWDIPINNNFNVLNIDDLWLSFIVKKYYGWEIKFSNLYEKESLNYQYSNSQQQSLYLTLHKEKQYLL